MNKVYIVYGYTPYDGESTYGVYSTSEKAEEKAIECRKSPYSHGSHETYGVEEYEVDADC